MIDTREATTAEAQSWFDGWSERLHEWYGACSHEAEWVSHNAERRKTRWESASDKHLFTLLDGGEPVGQVALTVIDHPAEVVLIDLWIAPAHRRRGFGRAGLQWVKTWAAARADRLVMSTMHSDPAQEALFGPIGFGAQFMLKSLVGTPELHGVIGRPMTEQEFGPWREKQVVDYAAEITGSGLMTPAEAMERAVTQFEELLPQGLATPGHTFLCVQAAGEVVATNWLGHDYAPRTSFVYGVEVVSGYRGKGYGKAAMLLGEQASLDAGDTQLGLNVFRQNATAIGLYNSMGYRTVEVHRSLSLA